MSLNSLSLNDELLQVSLLAVPSTRTTVSGVPPFIPNEALHKKLKRFGKFASSLRSVALGCKVSKLEHVQSLRRQVFMFLKYLSELSMKKLYGVCQLL